MSLFSLFVIQPSSKCNYNCTYCYIPEDQRRESNKMSDIKFIAKKREASYNEKLEQFFINSSEDQLVVETILLDRTPTDFATRRYADITVFFYNVRFLGKKWDGIEIRFGTDKNNKKSYKQAKQSYLLFHKYLKLLIILIIIVIYLSYITLLLKTLIIKILSYLIYY